MASTLVITINAGSVPTGTIGGHEAFRIAEAARKLVADTLNAPATVTFSTT